MVKFVAKFPIKPECTQAYIEGLRPCVEKTRQEPGCLEYAVFFDRETNVCTLMETFADEAAAKAHAECSHFVHDFTALSKYYAGKATVDKYGECLF